MTSLFTEYLNSFGDENGFNDIRDNERRGAKHSQRSDDSLHAMAISSMASRWAATPGEQRPRLVHLDQGAVSSSRSMHIDPAIYRVAEASSKTKAVGFKLNDLTNPKVPAGRKTSLGGSLCRTA